MKINRILSQEVEDLRIQENKTLSEFSTSIGIDIFKYKNLIKYKFIEDKEIIIKIRMFETQVEQKYLQFYKKVLLSQSSGPYKTGKILSHLDEILKLKKNPQKITPITVEWHLSDACNNDCPFCFYKQLPNGLEKRIKARLFPTDLIIGVINDLAELKVKGIVYSGGGEPLLHPRVNEILRTVFEKKIHQGLITNGTFIDKPGVCKTIIDTCDWVRISVDASSEKVYKGVHGSQADFYRVINNIRNLIKKRGNSLKPKIGVSFLLTKFNFNDLQSSADLFKKIGVDYFQVKPIATFPIIKRFNSGNIFWRKEIFDQLLALSSQETKEYKIYLLGFKFIDTLTSINVRSFKKCYGYQFFPVITPLGEIYVCCLVVGNKELCYGKITKQLGFKDIWFITNRLKIGSNIDVLTCPINCKLSETNKTLESILGKEYEDENFLN